MSQQGTSMIYRLPVGLLFISPSYPGTGWPWQHSSLAKTSQLTARCEGVDVPRNSI